MDWNNDGSNDLLLGDAAGNVIIYLNTNNNSDPVLDIGTTILNIGDIRATPIVDDWDEDGRKDLLVGRFGGFILIYLNHGTDAAPLFTTSYNLQVGGVDFDIGTRAAPRIFDWNEDGLKDLLIGEVEGYVYYLENIGTNDAPLFNSAEKLLLINGDHLRFPGSAGPRSRLYVSDWNNDGHNDILLGGFDGRVVLFLAEPPVISLSIDIRPDSDTNKINLKSKGVIPVAILTTEDFAATTVDPLSVEFGPEEASEVHEKGHIEDVDEDGDLDLILHFRVREAGIICGDTDAGLTGETFDGQAIEGFDSVTTLKCE